MLTAQLHFRGSRLRRALSKRAHRKAKLWLRFGMERGSAQIFDYTCSCHAAVVAELLCHVPALAAGAAHPVNPRVQHCLVEVMRAHF